MCLKRQFVGLNSHGALRVKFQSLLKAGDAFLLIEAETPVQAPAEPELCLRRRRGDPAGVCAQVERVIHKINEVNRRVVSPYIARSTSTLLTSNAKSLAIDRRRVRGHQVCITQFSLCRLRHKCSDIHCERKTSELGQKRTFRDYPLNVRFRG